MNSSDSNILHCRNDHKLIYVLAFIILILVLFLLFLLYRTPVSWPNNELKYSARDFAVNQRVKNEHRFLGKPLNKQVCYENLKIIHAAFVKYQVLFWLSEGTALGFFRGNDFIDYDDDVDLGMLYRDRNIFINKILPKLISKGFKVVEERQNSSFIVLMRKNEKVDIDMHGMGVKCMSQKSECDSLLNILDLSTIMIDGLPYNLPGLRYILKRYGSDWNVPQRNKK